MFSCYILTLHKLTILFQPPVAVLYTILIPGHMPVRGDSSHGRTSLYNCGYDKVIKDGMNGGKETFRVLGSINFYLTCFPISMEPSNGYVRRFHISNHAEIFYILLVTMTMHYGSANLSVYTK